MSEMKEENKVPAYTRRAIVRYQSKFKRIHVSIAPEVYAIFEEEYGDSISFSKFVNDTMVSLLKKKNSTCGFGPGEIPSRTLIKKDVNIPIDMEKAVMDKFSANMVDNKHKWVSFTGIVNWAVMKRLKGKR